MLNKEYECAAAEGLIEELLEKERTQSKQRKKKQKCCKNLKSIFAKHLQAEESGERKGEVSKDLL